MSIYQWILIILALIFIGIALLMIWFCGGNEEGEYAHPSDIKEGI